MSKLTQKRCLPCEGGVTPMTKEQTQKLLKELPQWQLGTMVIKKEGKEKIIDYIYRVYDFKNYYKTMAFVNAIAWMAHQENHHPDLVVFYNQCTVQYSTHAIEGLSENDFICAAKVDELFGDGGDKIG